jgi:hypothetical protein
VKDYGAATELDIPPEPGILGEERKKRLATKKHKEHKEGSSRTQLI